MQLRVATQEHWRCTTHCRRPALLTTSCPLQHLTSSVRWAGDSFQDYSFTFWTVSDETAPYFQYPGPYPQSTFLTLSQYKQHKCPYCLLDVHQSIRTRERRHRVLLIVIIGCFTNYVRPCITALVKIIQKYVAFYKTACVRS